MSILGERRDNLKARFLCARRYLPALSHLFNVRNRNSAYKLRYKKIYEQFLAWDAQWNRHDSVTVASKLCIPFHDNVDFNIQLLTTTRHGPEFANRMHYSTSTDGATATRKVVCSGGNPSIQWLWKKTNVCHCTLCATRNRNLMDRISLSRPSLCPSYSYIFISLLFNFLQKDGYQKLSPSLPIPSEFTFSLPVPFLLPTGRRNLRSLVVSHKTSAQTGCKA